MKKQLLSKAMLLLCALIVGVSSAWADTTIKQTGFTAVSGTSLNGDTNVSFTSYQGGGTAAPAMSGSSIRLYQNTGGATAGYIVIGVANNYVIKSVTITTSATTTAGYKLVDAVPASTPAKSTFAESNHSCTANGNYTVSDISSQYVIFANFGTTNKQRLDISAISVTYAPAASVAAPTFSPSAGAVEKGTTVTLSTSTDGASIYYTTDGSTPTSSSMLYSSAITINSAQTIKAIAIKGGESSSVATAAYTILKVATPTFSVASGMVSKGSTVTISSETDGASIYYTTDGATPTSSSTAYSGAITINTSQTIKAIAVKDNYDDSEVASVDLTIFEGTVVTLDATSDKGTSPLTKNGVRLACTSGVLNNGSEYRLYKSSTTTISVEKGKIVRIEFTGVSENPASGFGAQTGWTTDGNDGTWTGNAASVTFTASVAQVRATQIKVFVNVTATPTFSVAEGTYSEAKNVEISCATDGASIYYTTDGTTPTSGSTAYSSAIAITETTTLKAIAIKDGVESDVVSATYTMNRPEAPTFDVEEGTFGAAFDLHLSTATDGAAIYYTTDGTTPTASSTAYADKVAIAAATTTVKAIAVKNGLTSDVASATYTYDTRPAPTFTLSATSIDLKVNETSSAVTLTTNSDGAVAFACADAHVTLTGTGNSRTIKADAAGTYTVTVSTAATSNYLAANGTITVIVTKKATTIDLATSFTSKDIYVTTTGSVTGTVKYNGEAIVGAEVSYSSSDETVATIAADGTITFKKAGSTTITASYAGDDEYEACEATYELELDDTTPQETSVSITFNNTLIGVSSGSNTSSNVDVLVDNVRIQMNKISGSNYPFGNADEVRFYNKTDLVFTAPTGYVITGMVFTKGSKWANSTITANPGTWTESSVTWKGGSNSVTLTSTGTNSFKTGIITLAPTVAITSAGLATYVSDHALDYTKVEGLEAYIAKEESGAIKLTKVNKVPAGTGVLLRSTDEGTSYTVPVFTTGADDVSDNLFKRGTGAAVESNPSTGVYNYILNKVGDAVGFYRANNQTVATNRAYLQTSVNAGAGARLSISFDDDTDPIVTSVDGVRGKSGESVDDVFDLQGRKVSQPTKGLYIVNGKKVVIK